MSSILFLSWKHSNFEKYFAFVKLSLINRLRWKDCFWRSSAAGWGEGPWPLVTPIKATKYASTGVKMTVFPLKYFPYNICGIMGLHKNRSTCDENNYSIFSWEKQCDQILFFISMQLKISVGFSKVNEWIVSAIYYLVPSQMCVRKMLLANKHVTVMVFENLVWVQKLSGFNWRKWVSLLYLRNHMFTWQI